MAAKQLSNEMLKTINKIAPATTKAITSRHKNPGTKQDLKKTKKDHEKQRKETDQIEGRSTLEGIQKRTKQICHNAQIKKKCDLIHNLVNTNTKKLYKTVTEITSQNKNNALPESTTDQQLAEDFAT